MSWGVDHLGVRFGNRVALSEITLSLGPAQVHAVIGGDGAGKTTLLRILAGLNLAHTGEVTIPAPARIGFVPSAGGVFADLTVDENLGFIADAYRLREWRTWASELSARAGLGHLGNQLAGRLSGGQGRKLAGVMALLHKPDLLILDEATTGVDPVSRMELWRLITMATTSGAAIVIATTYLEEAERAASILLLHEGRALASGSPQEIIASTPGTVTDLAAPVHRPTAWRHGSRWRQWDRTDASRSTGTTTLEDAAIVRELIATGRAL